MNLQNISYLLEIEKYGSINKAAKKVFISQPRLSSIIRETEAEVGIRLFNRTKSGVTVTSEGHDFLLQAKSILSDLEALKTRYATAPDPDDTCSFRLSTTRSSHIMEVFVSFCAKYESRDVLRFSINEGNTDEVVTDVADNGYDLGVIFFNSTQKSAVLRDLARKGLEYKPFLTAKPHILLSKNHPLLKMHAESPSGGVGQTSSHLTAKNGGRKASETVSAQPAAISLPRALDLKALSGYGFVRYIDPYENFMHFLVGEDTLVDLNSSKKIIYVYGRSSMLHLISGSDFFGIGIRGFKTQKSLYGVVSVPIEGSSVVLEYGCIYPRDRALSKLATAFIGQLCDAFAQIRLEPATARLAHRYFKGFARDPATYMDMSAFRPFLYDEGEVDRYFAAKTSLPDRKNFFIMLGDEPIGELALKNIDEAAGSCELSVHMQNDAVKGRGFGTAAEREAVRYAFEVLGLETVRADTVLKNTRSAHVLEKAGFRFVREEGDFRYFEVTGNRWEGG